MSNSVVINGVTYYANSNSGNTNRSNNNYKNSSNNNRSNNKEEFKKSWAVYTKMRKGKFEGLTCVNAFRQTKFGLQKVTAFPVDGVIHIGKDKGHEFMRYVVTLTNPAMGTTTTYWCLMRLDTKTIVIKELSVCITPNGNGYLKGGKRVSGYFGRNYKS